MRKVIGGIGFVLVLLGVGCVDSPSMLCPVAMIATGAALIAAAAKFEEKWTKE